MAWIYLIVGGFCETIFATCLGMAKEASGTTSLLWYGGFLVSLCPIGTSYAVWTGIGAVGSVIAGIFLFKEPATFWRLFFLTTLVISIIGLKYVSAQ